MKVEMSLRDEILARVPYDAKQAENLGYDGLSSSETKHNPFFPLMLAAEHTRRATLTTAVAIAFPRSPMVTAYAAWDLQRFSNGRFILGLGTQVKGHNIRRYAGTWTSPGPRLRDYIGALRAIWMAWQEGSRLKYESEHYRIDLMTPNFDPGPLEHGYVPIYISAVNPYMCRLVGELCDGIRLHSFNTPEYTRQVILPGIQAGLAKAGRSRSEITICNGGFLATGRTEEEVERGRLEARRRIAFYGSTRTYHPVLAVHGWSALGEELHKLSLEGEWDEMARMIPVEVVDAFTTSGTYDEIIPRLQQRFGGLVDSITFTIPLRSEEDREQLQAMIAQLKTTPTETQG